MSFNVLANVLDALIELQETLSSDVSSFSRPYVRREHIPFLETRFRLFDEYLITRRPIAFLEFIRQKPDEFEDLYERIGSRLEHLRTHAGPISGRHRLMIYLRFVAQRMSFRAYALDLGMGKSTVSNIVKQVTEAIICVLHNQAFPPLTHEKFEDVATKTQERFDYPRAVGFIDGKHINIQKPARSGSVFWNYKHYYSIILLAIADADYRIMAYDIGAAGRAGDAGAFRLSKIKA
ncbi:unnamed protein product [Cylicocyclus nassatus]|uniref:DDE Tnp4 domain-containing protein n=1 Tax=Cylicocyclus nassatus TaxID=53992 RepID=A0AA36GMM4_CYLNA|nr:unnamed protein product [Cylicocyclus nassatus]